MPKTKKQKSKISPLPHSHEEILFSWIAPEYYQYHKSARWYAIAGIITLITILASLITGNWTLILAVITFASVYLYIHHYDPPKEIAVIITDMGVHVGDMYFPFSSIETFWIIYEGQIKTLNLRVHKRFYSDVIIQMNSQKPAPVREYLVGQVPEWEGKSENLSDIVTRLLRL